MDYYWIIPLLPLWGDSAHTQGSKGYRSSGDAQPILFIRKLEH